MTAQDFHARSAARKDSNEKERLDRETMRKAERDLIESLREIRTPFAQQEINRAIDIIRDAIRISAMP